MACLHLGTLGSHFTCFHRDQLPASEAVFPRIQAFDVDYDGRLLPLRYLVPYRGFRRLWIPVCEGRVHVYV